MLFKSKMLGYNVNNLMSWHAIPDELFSIIFEFADPVVLGLLSLTSTHTYQLVLSLPVWHQYFQNALKPENTDRVAIKYAKKNMRRSYIMRPTSSKFVKQSTIMQLYGHVSSTLETVKWYDLCHQMIRNRSFLPLMDTENFPPESKRLQKWFRKWNVLKYAIVHTRDDTDRESVVHYLEKQFSLSIFDSSLQLMFESIYAEQRHQQVFEQFEWLLNQYKGNEELLQYILETQKRNGYTVLQLSLISRNHRYARSIINTVPRPNVLINQKLQNGRNAMRLVMFNPKLLIEFIEKGADVNVVDDSGINPFVYALNSNHLNEKYREVVEALELIIEKGCDPLVGDQLALQTISSFPAPERIRFLTHHFPDIWNQSLKTCNQNLVLPILMRSVISVETLCDFINKGYNTHLHKEYNNITVIQSIFNAIVKVSNDTR
jgi:hypothetical protein